MLGEIHVIYSSYLIFLIFSHKIFKFILVRRYNKIVAGLGLVEPNTPLNYNNSINNVL